MIFALGRVTPDILAAAERAQSPTLRGVAKAALYVVPDLHMYSVSGRTLDGVSISVHADFVTWGFVGGAVGQGVLWIVGLVALASAIFARRDFV